MSYLICGSCGEHTPIFGSGGGKQLAEELQAPLLGQVPIDPRICAGGDAGQPIAMADSESLVAQVFGQMAAIIEATFRPPDAHAEQHQEPYVEEPHG